ncbi:MAG: S24 family peptidase [Xylophilus ampelinus]
MKTIGEIRLANLEQLVRELGTLEAVASRAESTSVYLSQVRNGTIDQKTGKPRQMGTAMARRIEKGCGKPEGWMDATHKVGDSNAASTGTRSLAVSGRQAGKVPVISWAQVSAYCNGDLNAEAVDAEEWFICPVPHSERTFAVRVSGESMRNPNSRPSYEEGEIIFVDPKRVGKPGDRVVACLEASGQATFKQLMEEDGRRFLKALNPDWTPRIIELPERARISGTIIGRWIPEQ